MRLKKLIQGIHGLEVRGSKEIEISGISADSNTVSPGNLFIARKGVMKDGADFIHQAAAAGASAIVSRMFDPFLGKTQLICAHPERIEALLAARYYGNPSKTLWVVGITGTKGKTTSSYLVRHLLEQLNIRCGLIGTIEAIIGDKKFIPRLTTHDAICNQKWLCEMLQEGCGAAVMEVSSHGLTQGRVDEVDFHAALFTNLYPDHLDYHKTVEEYAAAKRKLFEKSAFGIFNMDNPWAHLMMVQKASLTFGIREKADVQALDLQMHAKGTTFVLEYQGRKVDVSSPLVGEFNVSNLLGAIALGIHLKVDLPQLAEIFTTAPQIPGRLEPVSNDFGIRVFVDYAHTGDALRAVLRTLRFSVEGKLIVVFGCGGGRDSGRRRGMGEAAREEADLIVITSDNPRHEDPRTICDQIFTACQGHSNVVVEIDRRQAIHQAIRMAVKGDTVLIAGKGHERMQIFAHQTIPFDDVLVAQEALAIR